MENNEKDRMYSESFKTIKESLKLREWLSYAMF